MKPDKKPKLVVIVGPTASGKTALAIKLAKQFKGEIVSADSRQIYRGMNIGTAKASPKERKQVKHHLLDLKNPNQTFSLAQYQKIAFQTIQSIVKKKHLPFLVGGTGLYINSVVYNWQIPKVKANHSLRAKLEFLVKKHGLSYAFKKLIDLDPEAAYIVDQKNPRRVLRALEVAITSGQPFTAQRKTGPPLYESLVLGIDVPSDALKHKIAKRTKQMVKSGLVQEVQKLIKKYGFRKVPFDAIGYREIISHLQGKISLDQAVKQINQHSWSFVRRQKNWFQRLPVAWVKSQQEANLVVKKFLHSTD